MLCCVCVCVCLSIYKIIGSASSSVDDLEMTLNLLHHHHHYSHHPRHPASVQLPRVLKQLQLDIGRKQNEILMLLENGLNFEGKAVKTSIQMQE